MKAKVEADEEEEDDRFEAEKPVVNRDPRHVAEYLVDAIQDALETMHIGKLDAQAQLYLLSVLETEVEPYLVPPGMDRVMAGNVKDSDETRLRHMLEQNAEDWLSTSDLAYGLGRTTAAAGRVLDRMVKRGEVKTRRDDRMRRLWSLCGEQPPADESPKPGKQCLACGSDVPDGYMCQNPVHQQEDMGLCVCARAHRGRRECMEATGNKTPCRCLCHKRVVKKDVV